VTAADVVAGLAKRHETVATCESLTGGLVLAELTSVPGSSVVVRGGLVTYATDLKTSLAGVPAELIADHGVVSQPVAEAMAEGARGMCGATWGIGLTGVAGPDRVDGLAPGTVCIGVAGPDGAVSVQEQFPGDRTAVRRQTVERAFDLLRQQWTR
jgi:nicotinamide-nucleotide amidase